MANESVFEDSFDTPGLAFRRTPDSPISRYSRDPLFASVLEGSTAGLNAGLRSGRQVAGYDPVDMHCPR